MRRVVGIDPGCSGAIVLLAGDRDLVPVEWMRAPLVRLGKSSRLDSAALARFLGHHDVQHAYIEQVHSMPRQGVASSFGFGHAAGVAEGVVAALMIPTTLVTPQAWKKRAGLIGADKDAARSRAVQLWPAWDALGKKAEGQALADAALIARFGTAQ